MRANGYGADLEFDGSMVTIHAGKAAAKIQNSPTITFPVTDIVSIETKKANPLVNGSARFTLVDMAYQALQRYGASEPNTINAQSMIVHWRRKDDAAFTELLDAIKAAVPVR